MAVPYGDGTTEIDAAFGFGAAQRLESLANSGSLPAGLVRRAKIIFWSASGKNDREIRPGRIGWNSLSSNNYKLWVRHSTSTECPSRINHSAT